MPNARFTPYNHHDFATLSLDSGSTASGFFLTDTQNYNRSRVWKSGTTSNQAIKGVLPASAIASTFAIFLHNCFGSSVRLQLFSDAAWTTQVYDSTALPFDNVTDDSTYDWGLPNVDPLASRAPYFIYFAETTFRSYTISLSTNVNGAWQIGRIWLGKYFEPFYNPIFGATLGIATNSDFSRTRGGSVRANAGQNWRLFAGEFDAMPEYERAVWMDIMAHCGKSKDILVSLFPEDGTRKERDYTLDGIMTGLDPIGRQVSYLTKRFQFEEV